MNRPTGFILAAGKGSRLASLGLPTSKALVPVAGRPIVCWLAGWMREALERVVVVVSPTDYRIREALDGLIGVEVLPRNPCGTGSDLAWAVHIAKAQRFLVANADTVNDL